MVSVNIETLFIVNYISLLSKLSIKAANAVLDVKNDQINMFGQNIPLNYTTLPYLTIKDLSMRTVQEKEAISLKLDEQLGHPFTSKKLKVLIRGVRMTNLKSIDKRRSQDDELEDH